MKLLKNSFWNLAGIFIPSILSIPCMGILARSLSVGEFGLFALIFALIGYASIFDLGLNRAIIRFVAINTDNQEKIEKILGTSLITLTIIGCIISGIFISNINFFINLLNITNINLNHIKSALLYAGLSIPFFLVTQCFTGYLEGLQKFKLLNIQKTITSSLIVVLPICGVLIEGNIEYAIFGLFVARVLNLFISYLFYIFFDKVNLKKDWNILKEMFFFGGWVTVSNILSPVMVYFDKFFLSYFTTMTNVGFYTISTEVVNKISILPSSISRALFPLLSSTKNNEILEYKKSILIFFISITIVVIPIFIFADKLILIWVGEKYLGLPVDVLRILLIGLIFNSIAQAPFTLLQAIGLAKVTAIVHLVEIIPYLLVLYFLIKNYGIVGAAIAWSVRMFFDLIVLNLIALNKVGKK